MRCINDLQWKTCRLKSTMKNIRRKNSLKKKTGIFFVVGRIEIFRLSRFVPIDVTIVRSNIETVLSLEYWIIAAWNFTDISHSFANNSRNILCNVIIIEYLYNMCYYRKLEFNVKILNFTKKSRYFCLLVIRFW